MEGTNSHIFSCFSYQVNIPWGYVAEYQEEHRSHRIIMAHFLGASVLRRFCRETFCYVPLQAKLVRILLFSWSNWCLGEGLEWSFFICHKNYQNIFVFWKYMENLILSGYGETWSYYWRYSEQGGFPISEKIGHANVTGVCGWYCSTVLNQIVWFLGNFNEVHMFICFF